jgi:1-acyl-sn-glycerol-3-phosphate acyltransferase
VIVTPNHFSQMDHFLAGVYLRRKVQFMAKSQLFGNPFFNWVFINGGVFPVRRGYRDEEAFKTAHTVLDREGAVLMYAEGGRSRSGDLGEPKRGVGKLALESGAPVVPVAIHGSAAVRGWKRLHFPKVTVQYGEPLSFPVNEDPSHEQQQQVADQVFDQVRAMYVDLEENGRAGVLKRIRAGLPAGSPSPDAANARR